VLKFVQVLKLGDSAVLAASQGRHTRLRDPYVVGV